MPMNGQGKSPDIFPTKVNRYQLQRSLEYEVKGWPTSLLGAAVFQILLDQSLIWESLDRTYGKELNVGWLTSIEYGG
jgi:hypothetical protein